MVEAVLRARGYELKPIGLPLRGFSGCLEYAKSRGLAPKTVFDVGVGNGTPWLYDAFPGAKLVLFEPLSVFDGEIEGLKRRYDMVSHKVALGNTPGVTKINVNVSHPTSSSLFRFDASFAEFAAKVQNDHRFRPETVTVETLDRLNSYEPPYVLKLDVEGSERGVLEGARETLRNTEYLLVEMSVMHRQNEEPSFAEMIEFIDSCGFQLFDIPSLSQTKGQPQLIYLDAAFVPKASKLWPS
jgi:FkbM family methyltransferase